ncbi:protein of unknown function DUF1625 [[Leptolyngbya] sp. PCC 7376]|uniref:TMEM43 family protein n=1 Tax=[Leptolyngbya] sp. PCC 7376 TaxID=111781 RepID=UPI00029F2BA1|nr:TMEM43 family protein [[Leptolyngbya] sp. PCC 7376]AFY39596.1 protein of unknown function DUF1625 [[Leptolyngbya] sp. PCC 7376]
MSDQVVKTETIGYFERIKNSIIGVFLGILLFLISFGVLYWNEGRIDLSKVAKTSTEIAATGAPTTDVGEFVSVTGNLNTTETLGDNPYLAPGNYIALERKTEMFAWVEQSSTETKKNTGGSETKTTTYSYEKRWTASPANSANFEQPSGHQNPTKTIDNESFKVGAANVGDYKLDLARLSYPVSTGVSLSPENVLPEYKSKQSGNYLFLGQGTLQAPQIGDIRLSYQSLPSDIQTTVFGELGASQSLAPHDTRGISVYRLLKGTREEAIASLASSHKTMTWILRFVGFGMMWAGLSMMVEPLSVVLDFIPFLGGLSRNASGFVAFILAAILSSVTILISIILHSPIMIFLALGLSGFAAYRWTKRRKNKTADASA